MFSPLSLCRVRSMGVRRSPSPFDGTHPSTAKRCTSASFRQCKSALNSVFCKIRLYNRKNLYLVPVLTSNFCTLMQFIPTNCINNHSQFQITLKFFLYSFCISGDNKSLSSSNALQDFNLRLDCPHQPLYSRL